MRPPSDWCCRPWAVRPAFAAAWERETCVCRRETQVSRTSRESNPSLSSSAGQERDRGYGSGAPGRARREVGGWYHQRYHVCMAMTLRLDEQETEALRKRAEREGRSMQEVARQAVRDYVERTSKRELLDSVLDQELPRYAEALERLGK
jgi:plasmid stability protein